MWKARIEDGTPFGATRQQAPDPTGTPEEVIVQLLWGDAAHELCAMASGDDFWRELPDSATVCLNRTYWETFTPPRCRKPRRRLRETPVAFWPLGHLRRLARERAAALASAQHATLRRAEIE
jgi:hypothetical protein